MTPKKQRDVLRSAHLVAAVILIAYLYTPLGDNAVFNIMVRAMVVPVMVVTGLLRWQMPRIRKLLPKLPARWARGRGGPGATLTSVRSRSSHLKRDYPGGRDRPVSRASARLR